MTSLTTSQRAAQAVLALPKYEAEAKARQSSRGGTFAESSTHGPATDFVGKAFGVSGRAVRMAKAVLRLSPELFERVELGLMSLNRAYKAARGLAPAATLKDSRTALYRHYAEDGALLYVGIAVDLETRVEQHQERSLWFSEVHRSEVYYFPSRQEALAAERLAIQTESPIHNVRSS